MVGAAVGAAFSGFESMSYALDIATVASLQDVMNNQFTRSLYAVSGHVAYCIPYSCAIALNAEDGELKTSSFLNVQVLGAIALSIGLHWIWNSVSGSDILYVALCCVAPFRLIYWVRKCLTQIVRICGPYRRGAGAVSGGVTLLCKNTALEGKCWRGCREPLVIGREQEVCGMCFPANTPGVSREHCRVFLGVDGWMVQDLGSSYGTYVDGRRLAPQEAAPIRPGSNLYLGSKQVWIEVR